MRRLLLVIWPLIPLAGPMFAQDAGKNLAVTPTVGPLKGKPVYANSHALLIGINRYPGIPGKDLQFAMNDVRDMADTLVKNYGFPPANVRILTDSSATLSGIRAELARLADARKVGAEDRVLVYFSGHGQTVKLGAGGEMGFLIPHDAQVDLDDVENPAPFLESCLPMSQLWDYLGPSAAKHILVIADACYSGLLARARGRERISEQSLAQMAVTRSRQVIAAGQKGQVSYELAQSGHGAFTGKLLERLKALAVEDDVFTAQELLSDVARSVSNLSNGKQQPVIGSYETEGQFLFIPVAFSGPRFSAQELISSVTPVAKPVAEGRVKTQPSPVASARKFTSPKLPNLEVTIPRGWEIDTESNQSAGLYKPELKQAANPREFVQVYFRDVSRLWKHRPGSSWQEYTRVLVEEALRNRGAILEDEGYAVGKSASGMDTLTRRVRYRQSANSEIYWVHVGIRGGSTLIHLWIKCAGKDSFKMLEPEIRQIVDGLRVTP